MGPVPFFQAPPIIQTLGLPQFTQLSYPATPVTVASDINGALGWWGLFSDTSFDMTYWGSFHTNNPFSQH